MPYSRQVFYSQTIDNLSATKILSSSTGGTFTTGTSAGWTSGISSGATVVFTSTTAATNVSNLTATPSTPAIAPAIVVADGGTAATETGVVTFKPLSASQTITIAGLTFTAGTSGATAAQLATSFQSITASSTLASVNVGKSDATGGTFTSGAPSGWTSGTASTATVTFTSTTTNSNVDNISSALAVGTSAPTIVTSDGAAPGTTETAAVTFKAMAAGQTLTLAGLTFTAGASGATIAQVASAFASINNGTTAASVNGTKTLNDAAGGTFTSGTSADWASGAAGGAGNAVVTFTSATANANVTNLSSAQTITASAPTIVATDGVAATSAETAAVTFQAMTAGQTLSVAGLTFTAGTAGATADQVAKAFSSLTDASTADNANNIPPTMASAYVVTPGVNTNATSLTGYFTKPGDPNIYTFLATGTFTAPSADATVKLATVKGSITSFKTYINGALADSISYGGSLDNTLFGVTDSLVSPTPAATLIAQRAQAAVQFNAIQNLINTGATFIGSDASNGGMDQVQGGTSNDRFTGNGGNDYFDGKAGVDTAVFRGNQRDYTLVTGTTIDRTDPAGVNRIAAHIVTDTTANRDGVDTIANVERFQFADTTLALDIGAKQNAGSGYMLYKAAFNRTPDGAGLGYWINKMDTGMTYATVAQNFVNSAEFKAAFGGSNPTVEVLVTKLYNNVLNRTPDAAGLDFWQARLATGGGWNTADVLGYFSTSNENVANVTPLIANGIQYLQIA